MISSRFPATFYVLSLCIFSAACGDAASESTAPPANDWILAVETGLVAGVSLEGEVSPRWSISERLEFHKVPGVSVAVIEDGEIAWAKGWGVADTEAGTPVTPETLFQAASMSKPVAALAALSLVHDGVLDLDAPVNEYLRSWQIGENEFTADSAVTLRGILTHSAGLTVWGFPGYRKDEPFSVDQVIATNAQVLGGQGNTDEVQVYKIPGTSWQYSGGGYTLMEQVMEDVTGMPFSEVMEARVLGPTGMSLSTYEQPLPGGGRPCHRDVSRLADPWTGGQGAADLGCGGTGSDTRGV